MSGIREVKARGRRKGYAAKFFERGGKFRLDFLEMNESEKEKLKEKLGVHFSVLLKIVFRGRGGGEKEKIQAILATLYQEGKIEGGDKIEVERGLFREEVLEEGLRELEEIEGGLAEIYGEKRVIFKNKIEIVERGDRTGLEQLFDGERREEFDKKSAEEYFYSEFLVPRILKKGGREEDVIPQLLFSSLIEKTGDEKEDERRADFFVSDGVRGLVVEIDDSTHEGSEQKDLERDNLLRAHRIRVLRIKLEEFQKKSGVNRRVRRAFEGFYEEGVDKEETEGARSGKIFVSRGEKKEEILYQEVRFLGEFLNYRNQGYFQENEIKLTEKKLDCIKNLFKILFGYEGFREGQEEAIKRTLEGKDSVVLLPTGSGKSAIYQFLSLILPGVGLVIEPLRSLMEDQVQNLKRRGVETAVNLSEVKSRSQKAEVFELIREGAFSLIYLTPERLEMEEFRKVLKEAKLRGVSFSLVALDEAHCVSEWGHDFRVSYLNLGETARKILSFKEKSPVLLALTGTASDSVLKDIVRDLKISEMGIIQPGSFDRSEIHYRVIEAPNGEKFAPLTQILEAEGEGRSGIVFCVYKTGNTEFGVDSVYQRLLDEGREGVVRYYSTDVERGAMEENAAAFREDRARLMIATKAFGMGIDKGNVRFTVHYGIPSSIEAYYQEAGRAGRDGERATSYIILSNDAPERNLELINEVSILDLRRELNRGRNFAQDDASRVLFLHQKNYNKKEVLNEAGKVLDLIGEFKAGEKKIAGETRFEFSRMQKVLYRLKILNVISDYTIFNHANNEFKLSVQDFDAKKIVLAYGKYVAEYQEGQAKSEMNKIKRQVYRGKKEFILAVIETLVEFTNGVFEASRRRAIGNMLELAVQAAKIKDKEKQDQAVRARILDYLGSTYKELLAKILKDKKIVQEAIEAIKKVRLIDQNKLFGEVKRSLQAYPDHPGLLLTVGALEAISLDGDYVKAGGEILAAEKSAVEKYQISEEEMTEAILEVVQAIYGRARNEAGFRRFVEVISRGRGEEFKMRLLEILPERFSYLLEAEFLILNLTKTLARVKIEKRNLWIGKN